MCTGQNCILEGATCESHLSGLSAFPLRKWMASRATCRQPRTIPTLQCSGVLKSLASDDREGRGFHSPISYLSHHAVRRYHLIKPYRIKFEAQKSFALKVLFGGVNGISDEAVDLNKASQPNTKQDYVVVPGQPWLDGIATAPGKVKQFVAVPYGSGCSIEQQVSRHGFRV